ncbi:hypothetical protein CH366_18875 [Leptospira harrisiae]|nr:hypothetical protein CH366_18875 [Leptospira harrisiae]
MKFRFIYYILFSLVAFLISKEMYSEKKEQVLDFTQYEIKENYKFDCPKKKECFQNCSKLYVAMPWIKYDQFNTLEQISLNECNRKCAEITCSESLK